MKRIWVLLIALGMLMSLCACGSSVSPTEKADHSSAETVAEAPSSSLPKNILMYTPGTTVETDFGSIAVLDAAFCGKAQLIDGLPRPAYNKAEEGRIVFAMRAMISNTSDTDLALFDDLKVSIQYSKEDPFGCSKGGNYESSDPLYKILPAGTSGEYLISGRVPIEVYQTNNQFFVSFNDAKLGFDYQDIQVYNSMGYQEEDNIVTSIENIITPIDKEHDAENATENAPAFAFSLEDTRYEVTNNYLAIEAKIRNNSDTALLWPVFNGVILDANGDILENCMLSYSNGLEAGQAGWEDIRITEPTTIESMATIKLMTMWYKEGPQSSSHNLRFDLPEPLIIDLRKLEQK